MAENTASKEGYCVREIMVVNSTYWDDGKRIESSQDIVHLAKLPSDANERKSIQENLKRLGELEATENVKRYQEFLLKPEFQKSDEDKKQFSALEQSEEVKEFLSLGIKTLGIRDSATIRVPHGEYSVGDTIDKGVAEKDPSFKSAMSSAAAKRIQSSFADTPVFVGGHGSRSTK
jgi:hypothetical protein